MVLVAQLFHFSLCAHWSMFQSYMLFKPSWISFLALFSNFSFLSQFKHLKNHFVGNKSKYKPLVCWYVLSRILDSHEIAICLFDLKYFCNSFFIIAKNYIFRKIMLSLFVSNVFFIILVVFCATDLHNFPC